MGCSPPSSTSKCAATDDEAAFSAELEPCRTEACASSDSWFSVTEEGAIVLECVVDRRSDDPTAGRSEWVLAACTGERAPPSQTVRFVLDAAKWPDIGVGEEVQVAVYHAYHYDEHLSWAIRSNDGTLQVLYASGLDLPPRWMSAPLAITAAPQDCLHEGACGGLTARMEVTVASDEAAVVVPHMNAATIGTDQAYFVVVEHADYGIDSSCGSLPAWERFELLIVREPI